MLLIHQLSKESGIPIHTVRYYEKYGLFKGKKDPAVKSNNYTWYDQEVLERLELIQAAKEIGFTLTEIKKIIDAWYSMRLSKEKKKEILLSKIKEMESRAIQLKKVIKMLHQAIDEVDNNEC